jgi:hypothetical protein
LHSSDPSTVYLSARARVRAFVPADLETALYERRELVRMLGMRRTLFVVGRDVAADMHEACARPLAPRERRRLIGFLEDQGVTADGSAWVDEVAERTVMALAGRGQAASARELTADVPQLAIKLTFGEGKTWGGTVGLSTRILFLLANEGRIVRARPLGSWTSGQYRWARVEDWLGDSLPDRDANEARASLLRRWLSAFGPVTMTDVRWWTGWTAKHASSTLAAVGAVEVALEDGTGFVLPDDVARGRAPARWVALLPALDPTVMGWKERDWYLGPHGPSLFDRNGNAGPTVMVDGRIVGGWAVMDDGDVRVRLLEDVDAIADGLIDHGSAALRAWLGGVRVIPRFRSPLERELSS